MPNFTIPIPAMDETVKHNVLMSVVDRVLSILDIKRDDVILQLPYSNNTQPNTQVGVDREVSYGQNRRVFVDADEHRDPDNLTDRGTGFDSQPPFFNDKELDIRLHPALARYDYELTLNIRSTSRSEVSMWSNDVHRRASLGGDAFMVDADFHYVIPVPCVALLLDVHKAASAKVDIKPIGEWLRAGFINAVSVSNKSFIVRNTLSRILCVIDGPAEISKEKQDSGAWLGTLRIKFSVHLPEQIDVYYPPVINNTLIDQKWWQSMLQPGISDEANGHADAYVFFQDELAPQKAVIPIPVYVPDCDFPIMERGTRYPGELMLICGYYEMSAPELKVADKLLLNLSQLGRVKLKSRVLDYIKVAHSINNNGIDSVYRIYTYEDGLQLDRDRGKVTQQLDYYLTKEMSLTQLYQFGITVLTDFRYLSEQGKEFLWDFADIIVAIILDFRPDIANRYYDWWGLLIDGHLPYFVWNDLIAWLSGQPGDGSWTSDLVDQLRNPDWYIYLPNYTSGGSGSYPGSSSGGGDTSATGSKVDIELLSALYSAEQTFHTTSYNNILIIED